MVWTHFIVFINYLQNLVNHCRIISGHSFDCQKGATFYSCGYSCCIARANGMKVMDIDTLFLFRSLAGISSASLHSSASQGHSTFAARETAEVAGRDQGIVSGFYLF